VVFEKITQKLTAQVELFEMLQRAVAQLLPYSGTAITKADPVERQGTMSGTGRSRLEGEEMNWRQTR